MTRELEVLVDVAVLGKQVEEFYKADIGKFLLNRIEQEYNEGVDALKRVNPEDPKSIRDAQNMIWRAEELRAWLEEAIMAGLKAIEVLEDREE